MQNDSEELSLDESKGGSRIQRLIFVLYHPVDVLFESFLFPQRVPFPHVEEGARRDANNDGVVRLWRLAQLFQNFSLFL